MCIVRVHAHEEIGVNYRVKNIHENRLYVGDGKEYADEREEQQNGDGNHTAEDLNENALKC